MVSQYEIARKNIEQIAQLEATTKRASSFSDRISDFVSDFCGSFVFVYVHIAWFGAWFILNSRYVSPRIRFDPYPYEFLTLIVSLEAIFLSTFLLISQNRQAKIAERRNHLDLQVNILAEQENSKMLCMLEAIHSQLGIEARDPELSALKTETNTSKLACQIDTIMEKVSHECKS